MRLAVFTLERESREELKQRSPRVVVFHLSGEEIAGQGSGQTMVMEIGNDTDEDDVLSSRIRVKDGKFRCF